MLDVVDEVELVGAGIAAGATSAIRRCSHLFGLPLGSRTVRRLFPMPARCAVSVAKTMPPPSSTNGLSSPCICPSSL